METVRPCGCKGIRTCLVCENEYGLSRTELSENLKSKNTYVYCPHCDKAWPGWDLDSNQHPHHTGESLDYPGVYIEPDFLNKDEAESLIEDLDTLPWDLSQSGRRKQNYGPKCNFKKRRLRLGEFSGFPATTKFIQDKLSTVSILRGFKTIEQCSLEYNPERGASIDPHIDDCWIWGERIVTLNVTGDSVLTMTPYKDTLKRYNLLDVPTYPPVVKPTQNAIKNSTNFDEIKNAVIRLPMPARSLMVLYGAARYNWEHAVLREDISTRRVCIAYRELTPPYLPGGERYEEAIEILNNAMIFW